VRGIALLVEEVDDLITRPEDGALAQQNGRREAFLSHQAPSGRPTNAAVELNISDPPVHGFLMAPTLGCAELMCLPVLDGGSRAGTITH
jgi:hypothetical protein